jgi:hypothetical protein
LSSSANADDVASASPSAATSSSPLVARVVVVARRRGQRSPRIARRDDRVVVVFAVAGAVTATPRADAADATTRARGARRERDRGRDEGHVE